MLEEREKERSRRQLKIFKRSEIALCREQKEKNVEQRNEIGMYLKICLGLS